MKNKETVYREIQEKLLRQKYPKYQEMIDKGTPYAFVGEVTLQSLLLALKKEYAIVETKTPLIWKQTHMTIIVSRWGLAETNRVMLDLTKSIQDQDLETLVAINEMI